MLQLVYLWDLSMKAYSMVKFSRVLKLQRMHFLHNGLFEVYVRFIYVLREIAHSLLLLMEAFRLERQLLACNTCVAFLCNVRLNGLIVIAGGCVL